MILQTQFCRVPYPCSDGCMLDCYSLYSRLGCWNAESLDQSTLASHRLPSLLVASAVGVCLGCQNWLMMIT